MKNARMGVFIRMRNDMTHLQYLNEQYPTRRTDEEKAAFRAYIQDALAKKGIEANIEQTKSGKHQNIVVGNPLTAKAVFTAHYDTPARALLPNLMLPRSPVLFIAYQCALIAVLIATMLLVGAIVGVSWLLVTGEVNEIVNYFAALFGYYVGFYLMFFAFKNKKNYNDNTSGVATLLSIIDELSAEELQQTAFIFFDNEEKGKKGSKGYFTDHKEEMKDKLIINFDCVGNGEHIVFIAKPEAEKKAEYSALCQGFETENGFDTAFYPKKGSQANSDYLSFPCGVGCMACKKSKRGILYAPYIHTPKDVVVKDENIEYITRNIKSFVEKL